MKFPTRYTETREVSTKFVQPSQTIQQAKDECDINKIMKQFEETGRLPKNIKGEGIYEDCSELCNTNTTDHFRIIESIKSNEEITQNDGKSEETTSTTTEARESNRPDIGDTSNTGNTSNNA